MPPEITIWVQTAKDLTITGALVFILIGGARKVWAWGHQLADERQRRVDDAKVAEDRRREETAALREEIREWKAEVKSRDDHIKRLLDIMEAQRERNR